MQNLKIQNIKLSCKINNPTTLDYVKKVCSEKKIRVKDCHSFLIIYGKFVTLLFKASKVFASQHANVTKIRENQIDEAKKELSSLVDCEVDEIDHKIDTLTITGDLESKINLCSFVLYNSNLSGLKYDPQIFPAVFAKINNINTIIFSSGKVS